MLLLNTLITNVPGPTTPGNKYIAGAELLTTYPVVPASDGVGLCLGITGLNGRLALCVLADRKILPGMSAASRLDELRTRQREMEIMIVPGSSSISKKASVSGVSIG